MEYNFQLLGNDTTNLKSFTGGQLLPGGIMNPCGLIARANFTDSFQIRDKDNSIVKINDTAIASKYDREYMFKRNNDYKNTQWLDVENEHFMIWMSMETFSHFKKIWGRIETDLPPGTYKILIKNLYNVSKFDSQKYFVLAKPMALGKSGFFGLALMLATFVTLISILFLSFLCCKNKNEKFDETKLKWK
jgi:hypothetical protein